MVAKVHTSPCNDVWTHFLRFHRVLEDRFELQEVDEAVMRKIASDGRLFAVTCEDATGRTLLVNLIYLSTDSGYFLHGASAELPPGAGQLAHWTAALHLKSSGMSWYDLGGVLPDPANGIHRFKASLGGDYYDLGREYRYTAPAVAGAYHAYRRLRTLTRHRHSG